MLRGSRLLPLLIVLVASAAATVPPREALAIPYFAHEYAMTCQKCHSVIPRLNEFGTAFMDHGYSLPGATPQRVFPIAGKFNLLYSSAQPEPQGLPKAIVDEIELFVAGKPTDRTNYFVEQYVVDGGEPGSLRDGWLAYRLTPNDAKVPVYAQAGQFGLPLPVDPESFRETYEGYAPYLQTVGDNPFDFFTPKIGVQVRAGSADRGLSVRALALQGHDQQSGLPAYGTDVMGYAQQIFGPFALSTYHYEGARPDGPLVDRFWRQGYGVTFGSRKWVSESVWQTGNDSAFERTNAAAMSSGGFTQLRYEIDRRLFALARYEGTNGPTSTGATGGFERDFVGLLGYRVSRNSRFTVEDVVQHVPATTNTLNMQYTAGY